MIPLIGRSILLLGGIFSLVAVDVSADPMSVIDSFQNRYARVTTLHATLERYQTYRSARREAHGSIMFDRKCGCVYSWQSPGNFRFFSSDSMLYGIDTGKRTGWRTEKRSPDVCLREQIDPLFRLFRLSRIDRTAFVYRGNSDELLLFSSQLPDGRKCTVGFETTSCRCRIIETFDTNGTMIDKTKFTYMKKEAEGVLPTVIIISERIGADVSVDSIVIKKPRVNKTLKRDVYTIPGNVTWRVWPDSLVQLQFDTIPGP